MKTIIYKTRRDFLNREDKSLNGVSRSFAKKNPHYIKDNQSNSACWNCSNCTDCSNCNNCNNCNNCYDCHDSNDCNNCNGCGYCSKLKNSDGCWYCNKCTDCRFCVWCEDCENCENCRHCHACRKCKNCKFCGNCYQCSNLSGKECCLDNHHNEEIQKDVDKLKQEIRKIKTKYIKKIGWSLVIGGAWGMDENDNQIIQVCLESRKDGKGAKKEIKRNNCSESIASKFHGEICANIFDEFLKICRKKGFRIIN